MAGEKDPNPMERAVELIIAGAARVGRTAETQLTRLYGGHATAEEVRAVVSEMLEAMIMSVEDAKKNPGKIPN